MAKAAPKRIKALFVGLGSIGSRHLRDLVEICTEQKIPLVAEALRSGKKPLPEETAALLAAQFTTLPTDAQYDLAFITGPTHTHEAAIAALKDRVGAFYIEKPIFDTEDVGLEAIGLWAGQKAYVAAPMRHTRLYGALAKRLEGERVYSARALCSSYLPDWRPGTDYRQGYSALREMGGGVALDLVHEWDYLVGLFGIPQECVCIRGKYSHLEIDSDDLAVYIGVYPGMVCEIHLDYFGRQSRRTLELLCEEGTLTADFLAGTLALPDGTVEDYSEPPYSGHRRELEYFLRYAREEGFININSPRRAMEVLNLALGE